MVLAVSAVAALAVAGASIFGYSLYVYADNRLPVAQNKAGAQSIGKPCLPDCNYLLMGNDSRKGLPSYQRHELGASSVTGQRSDTIMLVHVDPRQKRAIVLSFPRDLWVRIPGVGMGKITSAYEGSRPDRVARAVEDLTGLHINHYLSVSLAGFESVVQSLGGVPICLDRPLYDFNANLNLPAGCQTLGPVNALAFVRARHVCGDRIPDFSRISRQQQFLRAVLAKILSPAMFLRAKSLLDQIEPNLLRDPTLNLADIIYLTHELQGISTGEVDFRAVPGNPYATVQTPEGTVDVVRLKPEAKVLFRRLREGQSPGAIGKVLPGTPPSPATIRVRVFDDSSGGVAQQAYSLLSKGGFDIQATVPAGTLASRGPAILFRPGADREAKVVHRFLPDLPMKEAPKNALAIDVAVVVDATTTVPSSTPTATPSPPSTPGSCG